MYHVMHNTCTMHGRDIKTQYIGSISILLFRKDWHSITLDRRLSIIFEETIPASCIPKVVRLKTGEVLYEKKTFHLGFRQISLKHEWKRELVSEHAQRWEAGQLSRSFQPNQPTLSPIRERSGRPDIKHDVFGVQDERKRSVLRRSMLILFAKSLVPQSERSDSLRENTVHETSVIQTRSSEDKGFQRWTGTWANGATRYHARRD